jgi:hypothetical protein
MLYIFYNFDKEGHKEGRLNILVKGFLRRWIIKSVAFFIDSDPPTRDRHRVRLERKVPLRDQHKVELERKVPSRDTCCARDWYKMELERKVPSRDTCCARD